MPDSEKNTSDPFKDPLFRVGTETYGAMMTICGTMVSKGGLKGAGAIIGNLSEFTTLAEHINQGSSFGDAALDIGLNIVKGHILGTPISYALKVSELANYNVSQTPAYMKLYGEDDIDRLQERGIILAMALPYKLVEHIFSAVKVGITAAANARREKAEELAASLHEHLQRDTDDFGQRMYETAVHAGAYGLGKGLLASGKHLVGLGSNTQSNTINKDMRPPLSTEPSSDLPGFKPLYVPENPYEQYTPNKFFPVGSLETPHQSYQKISRTMKFDLPNTNQQLSLTKPTAMLRPDNSLPIHGNFEYSSSNGWRAEVSVPIAGSGSILKAMGIPGAQLYVIVAAAAWFAFSMYKQKKDEKKAIKLGKKINRSVQNTQKNTRELSSQMSSFSETFWDIIESGDVEEKKAFISTLQEYDIPN